MAYLGSGMRLPTCNPITCEAEIGELLSVQGQPGLRIDALSQYPQTTFSKIHKQQTSDQINNVPRLE